MKELSHVVEEDSPLESLHPDTVALYNELTPDERAAVRDKLARQAHLMYEYFKYKPKKKYAYSQNHTFIPITGLGVAAYALYDETPEAPQWASLTRAIYDRVLATYSTNG